MGNADRTENMTGYFGISNNRLDSPDRCCIFVAVPGESLVYCCETTLPTPFGLTEKPNLFPTN